MTQLVSGGRTKNEVDAGQLKAIDLANATQQTPEEIGQSLDSAKRTAQKEPTTVRKTLEDAKQACIDGIVSVGGSVQWLEVLPGTMKGGDIAILLDAGVDPRPEENEASVHWVGTEGLYLQSPSTTKTFSLEQFGCLMDGSDETIKFQRAINAGLRIEQNSGHISLSGLSVTNPCNIRFTGNSKVTMLKSNSAPTISVNTGAENSYLEFGGPVDGNASSRSFIALNTSGCSAFIHNISNITADFGSTESVSALEVNAENCKFLVDGHDFSNTGQVNESVPRLVSIQNTAKDYYGFLVRGRNIQGGVTTGAPTGAGHIEMVDIDGIHDNGVYNIGNGLSLGEVIYKGGEEAIVNKGRLTSCRKVTHIGSGHSPLNIDDAEYTNVDEILLVEDLDNPGQTPSSAFILRGTNISSGYVRIGNISGVCYGTQLFAAPSESGTIDRLVIEGCVVDFYYTGDTVLNRWMAVNSAKEYDIKDIRVKFIDTTDALTYSDRPQFSLPTAPLAPSFIRGINLNAVLSDGLTKSPVEMRIHNVCVENCYHEGMRLQTNAGPYGREIEFGAPQSVFGPSNIGSRGWWRAGEDFSVNGATAAPFRVRVTVSGDPATAVTY